MCHGAVVCVWRWSGRWFGWVGRGFLVGARCVVQLGQKWTEMGGLPASSCLLRRVGLQRVEGQTAGQGGTHANRGTSGASGFDPRLKKTRAAAVPFPFSFCAQASAFALRERKQLCADTTPRLTDKIKITKPTGDNFGNSRVSQERGAGSEGCMSITGSYPLAPFSAHAHFISP